MIFLPAGSHGAKFRCNSKAEMHPFPSPLNSGFHSYLYFELNLRVEILQKLQRAGEKLLLPPHFAASGILKQRLKFCISETDYHMFQFRYIRHHFDESSDGIDQSRELQRR